MALEDIYQEFDKQADLPQPFLYQSIFPRCIKAHEPELYDAYWYHPDHLEGGALRKQPVAVFSERASLPRRQNITNLAV